MKFLIYDYTNQWNTESLYFNAGINLLNNQNISSHIFNNNMSVYDNIDNIKPDAVITNIKMCIKTCCNISKMKIQT